LVTQTIIPPFRIVRGDTVHTPSCFEAILSFKSTGDDSMIDEQAYPRTAKYDERWIRQNALGENALCQAESLARHLPFRSGMRVLDLGCGKAASSIFLAREFDLQVWATDSGTSATENFQRAIALESERRVFPLRVDAHSLPFAKHFFDAVVAIDSYLYFGTDERYLSYIVQFIKPGGYIGVVDIGFRREIRSIEEAPEYLRAQYEKFWSSIHTDEWWRQHWQKTGLVDVQCSQFLPASDRLLRDYWTERPPDQDKDPIMRAVPNDREGLIGLFCLVGRKR
jgi:cyclopropane fatty-acyl-phospholipid synthase-like methyltransferase